MCVRARAHACVHERFSVVPESVQVSLWLRYACMRLTNVLTMIRMFAVQAELDQGMEGYWKE